MKAAATLAAGAFLAIALGPAPARAAGSGGEPREREMTADRPGAMRTPLTLEPGRFQVESGLVRYSRRGSPDEGGREREWTFNDMELRLGITDAFELQLLVPPRVSRRTEVADQEPETKSGFGDFGARAKFCFEGCEGDRKVSAALLVQAFQPAQHGGVGSPAAHGGAHLPIVIAIAERWELGLQPGWDWVRNSADLGYHTELSSVVSVARSFGALGAYAEINSVSSSEKGAAWEPELGVGFTLRIGADLQLDLGADIGLDDPGYAWSPFAGVALRF